MIATDGRGVVTGKEVGGPKSKLNPIKPRTYIPAPVEQLNNDVSNEKTENSDESSKSTFKKFLPLTYILPILGVALLCMVKGKKHSDEVST